MVVGRLSCFPQPSIGKYHRSCLLWIFLLNIFHTSAFCTITERCGPDINRVLVELCALTAVAQLGWCLCSQVDCSPLIQTSWHLPSPLPSPLVFTDWSLHANHHPRHEFCHGYRGCGNCWELLRVDPPSSICAHGSSIPDTLLAISAMVSDEMHFLCVMYDQNIAKK